MIALKLQIHMPVLLVTFGICSCLLPSSHSPHPSGRIQPSPLSMLLCLSSNSALRWRVFLLGFTLKCPFKFSFAPRIASLQEWLTGQLSQTSRKLFPYVLREAYHMSPKRVICKPYDKQLILIKYIKEQHLELLLWVITSSQNALYFDLLKIWVTFHIDQQQCAKVEL